MSMRMPPETTMVVEHPITRADFARPEVHTVDTNLLIQDTHVHVPMYGIIAASLSVLVAGLSLRRGGALGLITLLFSAPWLRLAGLVVPQIGPPPLALGTPVRGR